MTLYIVQSFITISSSILKLLCGHKSCRKNQQRDATPTKVKQSYGSYIMHAMLMMLYICIKFHEKVLNGFKL